MKKIALTTAGIFSAAAAHAGNVSYQSTASHVAMADAMPMGGAAEWLVPLIALAIIALLVSGAAKPATPPAQNPPVQNPPPGGA